MTAITITVQGAGLPKFEEAVEALGSAKATRAYRMALNATGKRVFTQVKKAVAGQMGASQARVVKYGQLRRVPASGGALETRIESKGGYIPLKDFSTRSTRRGVTAAPWGQRRLFKSTFIVPKLGGQVFKRTSGARLPIESLWGPAVPKELVKDQSKAAFDNVATAFLPREVERVIKQMTKGAVS
ncbi:phage tail protein [Devosia naphthalenivorans]|uniref:phage tail protein n=1 Tax=Devosia naphthalenivorans TaxID=2082392 RepID=UPI000D36F5B0|nr:phage tail protein [Devosia naphthalenivorans]